MSVRGMRGQASTVDRQLDSVSQGLRCGQTSSLPTSGNLKEKGKFVRVEMKRIECYPPPPPLPRREHLVYSQHPFPHHREQRVPIIAADAK